MSEDWELKILCMGAGYVGGPTMAVIAKQCPKVRFTKFRGVRIFLDGGDSFAPRSKMTIESCGDTSKLPQDLLEAVYREIELFVCKPCKSQLT
jgi:hypothetical protein